MFTEYLTKTEAELAQEMYNSLQITHPEHQFTKKISPVVDKILQKKSG